MFAVGFLRYFQKFSIGDAGSEGKDGEQGPEGRQGTTLSVR